MEKHLMPAVKECFTKLQDQETLKALRCFLQQHLKRRQKAELGYQQPNWMNLAVTTWCLNKQFLNWKRSEKECVRCADGKVVPILYRQGIVRSTMLVYVYVFTRCLMKLRLKNIGVPTFQLHAGKSTIPSTLILNYIRNLEQYERLTHCTFYGSKTILHYR